MQKKIIYIYFMQKLVPIHKSFPFSSCQDKFPLWADCLKSEPIMNENVQIYFRAHWKEKKKKKKHKKKQNSVQGN